MKRVAGALILFLVCGAGTASGQSKVGTTIGQFMCIEPSARVAALGNAGVALYEGVQSVYYNPAALGSVGGPAFQFTHSEWFAGIAFDYAAAAFPIGGFGTVFASLTALNSGDILVRTVSRPEGTGESFTVSNLAVGLGYGLQITDRFGAGIQINYVSETIWHSSVGVLGLNLGTVFRLTDGGLRIGASISNLGTSGEYSGRDLALQYDRDPDQHGDNSALPAEQYTGEFPLPILFRVGVSFPRQLGEKSRLLVTADALHPSDNSESLSLGMEWSWQVLSLRAGYQSLFQEDSEFGPTLGAGIETGIGKGRFQFDYAWADHNYLQETHRVTFVLAF
jgi:hypothetical protein